jgi:hypothetical protein
MFGEVAKGILRNIWDMLVANGCILCTRYVTIVYILMIEETHHALFG